MRPRLLAGAAIAAVLTVAAAVPAQAAVTLSSGHIDILDVDWTGSALTLDVRDYGAGIDRDPADVILQVKAAARTTVPAGSQYGFLGNQGDSVWILPQGQPDATSLGVLYAGWNSNGVTTTPPGAMTIRLVSVSGPDDFSLFTTGTFGNVTVLLDSGNGLPDTRALGLNQHEHANWAFEAPGPYTVVFEVTAAGGISTGEKTYRFDVLA